MYSHSFCQKKNLIQNKCIIFHNSYYIQIDFKKTDTKKNYLSTLGTKTY